MCKVVRGEFVTNSVGGASLLAKLLFHGLLTNLSSGWLVCVFLSLAMGQKKPFNATIWGAFCFLLGLGFFWIPGIFDPNHLYKSPQPVPSAVSSPPFSHRQPSLNRRVETASGRNDRRPLELKSPRPMRNYLSASRHRPRRCGGILARPFWDPKTEKVKSIKS